MVAAVVSSTLTACGDAGTNESDPFFSVNGDVLFVRVLDGQVDTIDAPIESIARSGIASVRSSIDWRRLQPTGPDPDATDFSLHDLFVERLATQNLRWAPSILGWPVPPWAADPALVSECGSRSSPADVQSYAAMVGLLAERYGRDGSFWADNPDLPYLPITRYEVWNEPNHGAFWCPAPDPARFADLTIATSQAVRGVDPEAEIELGGLAGFGNSAPDGTTLTPAAFVAAAAAARPTLADAIDLVALHPYAPEPADVAGVTESFRAALDATPLAGKPIVVNEIGWPTQGTTGFTVVPDEATRAEFLASVTETLYERREELGIDGIAPYSWVTREADPQESTDWFGLADPLTGEPNEAGAAYADAVERLSSPP